MKLKKDKMFDLEKIREHLNSLSDEEFRNIFPKDNTPKGWVDIEDHLPKMNVIDYFNNGTSYLVRDKNGKEFYSKVMDHNIWYYDAKELGITHWFNE